MFLLPAPPVLFEWRNGATHLLTSHNGLPCDRVNAFVSDADGNLWLDMQCGLAEVKQSDLQRWQSDPTTVIHPFVYDMGDGVKPESPPFEGAARSSDGRLWFNSSLSLQMVDPAHLVSNPIVPPVHIETVVADQKSYKAIDVLRLPPLTHELEIDYAAMSFVAPEKTRFRYRLSRS